MRGDSSHTIVQIIIWTVHTYSLKWPFICSLFCFNPPLPTPIIEHSGDHAVSHVFHVDSSVPTQEVSLWCSVAGSPPATWPSSVTFSKDIDPGQCW